MFVPISCGKNESCFIPIVKMYSFLHFSILKSCNPRTEQQIDSKIYSPEAVMFCDYEGGRVRKNRLNLATIIFCKSRPSEFAKKFFFKKSKFLVLYQIFHFWKSAFTPILFNIMEIDHVLRFNSKNAIVFQCFWIFFRFFWFLSIFWRLSTMETKIYILNYDNSFSGVGISR